MRPKSDAQTFSLFCDCIYAIIRINPDFSLHYIYQERVGAIKTVRGLQPWFSTDLSDLSSVHV